MLLYTSNFSWGDKLCIVSLCGPCVWFCTFQLHWNSSNLDTAQDMYKFIDKMSIGNGLQGLTCWAASLWNLLGLRACLQFGQSPCNPVKNGTYIYSISRTFLFYATGIIQVKPFYTSLLSVALAYIGYHRYVHNHICVLTCNDPLLNWCGKN